MATTFDALHRRNRAAALRRLMNEQRVMAERIGRLLQSSASGRDEAGQAVIPNRRSVRDNLKLALWLLFLKPYYWGRSDEPFRGTQPQSPYAETLLDGIDEDVDIEVVRQVSIIQRATADPMILGWLFGERRPSASSGTEGTVKPPFAEWTDPSGFRLNDRVVRVGIDARARLNRFVDYHVGQGTPVQTMTNRLEKFMTTGEPGRTPYGQQGSYAARRLLSTEMKTASGYAAINASAENPMVEGIKWQLNRLYDESDRCDRNSIGGPNGDGVYPALQVPGYPDHPNEQCDLLPVPAANITDELRKLHDDIVKQSEDALRLAGKFSPEALRQELLGITTSPQLSRVSPRVWVRNADGTLTWRFRDPNQADPSPPTALLRQRQAERAAALSPASARSATAVPEPAEGPPAVIAPVEPPAPTPPATVVPAQKPVTTDITLSGDIAALEGTGFTQEKIERLFDIGPNVRADIQVVRAMTDDGIEISIVGKWTDKQTGELIGTAARDLIPGQKKAYLSELSFESKYIGNGRGINVARSWFDALQEAGYEKAELYSGMTIGRYAWAKEGAVYADPRQAERSTQLFRQWLTERNITDLTESEYPKFTKVLDVATYRHPRGVTLLGKDIKNRDVPAEMVLPLGKAFMLDISFNGHGGWHGQIDLVERARRLATITEMSDGGITEIQSASRFVYIDGQRDGLSDALFWKEYLVDDDSNVAPLVL